MTDVRNHANLIWGIAELLRGDYKRADYGKVVLPLVVMRRLDQVLEPTRDHVIAQAAKLEAQGVENLELVLRQVAGPGMQFFNRHKLRFHQLLDDPGNIADYLHSYIGGYSILAREVVDKFEFEAHIDRLDRANLLYRVIARVCEVDLHPHRVSNHDMGAIFEELIRKFAEQSNETAGEHFTPREVVRLMVNLLLSGDADALRTPGTIRHVFDCACGTGGMLSEAEDQIHRFNSGAVVRLFGQELNPESYAICLADMLVKGQDASHIVFGNSLSADGHAGESFNYCIANPPFGVDWSKVVDDVVDEHERLGFDGRFGAGLPRKSDGQLLFLMHLLSKMRKPTEDGTRVAIVHNGSPLFTGGAGSGESNIRRWIIENDWLEAIVALPEQLFYNTGIASYVWLLTNRKSEERRGKVQLIDAREQWVKMRKSLGDKRRMLSPEQIEEVTRLHGAFEEGELVKVLPNEAFGYRTITVDRPLRAYWSVGPGTWEGLEDEKARRRDAGGGAQRTPIGARAAVGDGGGVLARAARSPDWRSGEPLGPAAEGAGGVVPRTRSRAPRAAQRQGPDRVGPGAARHGERSADGGRGRVLRARGTAPRPRRGLGRSRGEDRLPDPFHSLLLQVHPPSAEPRDQGRAARTGGPNPAAAGGGARVRLKHLARVPIVAGLNVAAQEGEPGWPRFIRTTDVVAPRALGPQVVRVPPSDVGGCEVLRRDLLFCRTGSPGTVYFHESGETAAFAGYLVRVRPDPTKVVPEFLAYWAESSPCRRQIMQGTIRSTVDNFNATKVANLVSPEMSALNQRKTVAFLDRECARLENLQIECARFESEAFAPALARFADLTKPWPRGRIGYRYSVQLGKMLDEKRIEADDVHPYLRNSNVQWDSLVLDDLKQMSFSPAERRKYELRPGDLLVCEGGQPGRSAIWDGSVPDCYFQKALMRVRPRAAESTRFLMWCLRLAHGCGDFAAEGTGSTILHLPAERLIATRISLPHADEQRAITREVDNLAARVSGVARETAHVRALLVEYRGALITEAVMGNLDVTSLSESQLGESAEAAMEGERPAVLSA